MRVYLLCLSAVVFLYGCSNNDETLTDSKEVPMSSAACEAVGGKLEGGHCMGGEVDMKKICAADNLEYSPELDACLLGADEMRKICAEKNMKYSETHNGCLQ